MYNYDTNSTFENNLTVYGDSQNNERMNISYFQYFSTFSLMMMCYSFINPNFIFNILLYLTFTFANTFITSYVFFNNYIYAPYNKYIRRPLYYILNISDKNDEIQIIKDGVIIYSFRTMKEFINNNPFEFIPEHSDDEDTDNSDAASKDCGEDEDKQDTDQPHLQPHHLHDIETPVDADLTNTSVNIHEKSEGKTEDEDDDKDEEDEDDEDEDEDEDDTDSESGYILNPYEYDFIIRTFYYETKENDIVNTHSYCLKYDTFFKSDLTTTYTHEELNKEVSYRKFIGSNITFKGVKYIINLTTPDNYYVVNNSILDYSFLVWYMANHYDIILTKKYTVSCIDNFVEMYTIKPGQKIIIEKNSLRVTEDESFVESGSESGSDTDTESRSDSDIESDTNELKTETENQTNQQEEITNSSDTNDVEILERCD